MFYYDGINEGEIDDLFSKGIIRGVTTNLTLVNSAKKTSGDSRDQIIENLIESIKKFNLPLSVQVESNNLEDIIAETKDLHSKFASKIDLFVKIPANFENLFAIKLCSDLGIKINATCVSSFMQAKMCSLSGAKIVSFFWGKMYDQGINPSEHVMNFRTWIDKNFDSSKPALLVGSVRQIGSIESAFLSGADIVTTSWANFQKIGNQFVADQANAAFQESF
jgi:transaldolase